MKLWDKEFVLFTEATGALPDSQGSEDAERLPIQVLETQADKWMRGASMLQGISLKKSERERENDWHGEIKLLRWARPNSFILKGTFIPCLIHRGKWKTQGRTESAQTFQQFCPYQNQDFSAYLFHKWCCVQYLGLGGLWTFYDPLLIKAAQQKTYFPTKCLFFIFPIYVSLRKC